MRCLLLITLLFVAGCGSDGLVAPGTNDGEALSSPTTAPATAMPVAIQTAAPKASPHILIQFESIDCSCHLKDVDGRLLSLPGVVQVKWNTEEKTADLILDGSDVPTNQQITEMAQMPGVTVFNIKRP